ncbi:MAG: hypothetical protein CMH61_02725 [Nanoarchaeota archaeon]|nr:hypothetical protein [Nanoarchaeota archaeon]|tara:strand:- start:62 stop:2314 length:2253 start_codon:yes stop_codon:yes gene_type:complete
MPIVPETLDQAIESWERMVDREHALFRMPVQTMGEKDDKQHKSSSDWMFATDNEQVYALIFEPDNVENKIRKTVLDIYKTAYQQGTIKRNGLLGTLTSSSQEDDVVRMMAYHNAFSLLIHELFHPVYCPNSSWLMDGSQFVLDDKGKKIPGDQQRINQALYDGLKKALPGDKPADLIAKTKNIENTVWDFAIDTFQYYFISQHENLAGSVKAELKKSGYELEGKLVDQFPEGVVPLFDVVSYAKDDKLPKSVLALTRYTYGLLFCADTETREGLTDFFETRITNGGIHNIEQLVKGYLKGLLEEVDDKVLQRMGISQKRFNKEVYGVLKHKQSDQYDNTYVIKTMATVLMDKETRYDAIKGFIQPLAHLIDVSKPEQRKGQEGGKPQPGQGEPQPGQGQPQPGEGSGQQPSEGDISDVLEAILNGMDQAEGDKLLQALSQGVGDPNNPHTQQLAMIAKDDYYKKHAPKIDIRTPNNEAVIIDAGKIKEWVPDYSLIVPVQDLPVHQQWIDFGGEQNLPVLQRLSRYQYRVTYFKEEETELQTYDFQNRGIDVARNWILINDTSGTMGGGSPGSGTRFDGLLHIEYGMLKTLYDASEVMDQDVDVWVVNFSSGTSTVGPIDLRTFYDAKTGPEKTTLLTFQGGGTHLNTSIFPTIKQQLKPGRTVWTFATDGDMNNQSNSDDVYRNINRLIMEPEQCVLYFEMFQKGRLGQQIEALQKQQERLGKNNLRYQSVSNLQSILNTSLNVLIEYE